MEGSRRFSLITDEGLEALRRLIGVPVEDSVEPWCTEATRDNIRHRAHGIGDDNPLWCDPSYAETTPYGRIVAVARAVAESSPPQRGGIRDGEAPPADAA